MRDAGQKITPQRMAIVKILAKSEGHPSVENIYNQIKNDFPTMSLATVYRTPFFFRPLTSHNRAECCGSPKRGVVGPSRWAVWPI
ncbi:MAG: transcriptional repressor [Desulfobacteraceae bacterium]|nr:transcriptional repressor [Desulfobacteraceae bacterium]